MPNMPSTVTKTSTFSMMDTFWSPDPEARMNEYNAAASFKALLDDARINNWITQSVFDHVNDHWLQTYWPGTDPQEVLHRGLYWAMRVAAFHDGDLSRRRMDAQGNPDPLPICCAWVCSGGKMKKKKARFEVVSIESDHQLTLLFLTPPPEDLAPDKEKEGPLQRIWSTRDIDFDVEKGETKLEDWQQTVTARPHDYENYAYEKTAKN
jgi:hypothetical protein